MTLASLLAIVPKSRMIIRSSLPPPVGREGPPRDSCARHDPSLNIRLIRRRVKKTSIASRLCRQETHLGRNPLEHLAQLTGLKYHARWSVAESGHGSVHATTRMPRCEIQEWTRQERKIYRDPTSKRVTNARPSPTAADLDDRLLSRNGRVDHLCSLDTSDRRALETSVARVQFTFVAYLLAFAVSMLVLGPLSDRYGRRRTMILGIALSTLGSIACAASPTIEFLIAARILQGIGLSGGMVVGRATIRDLYGEEGAAQIIAGLSIVMTLLQAFAPIPGGYLQAWIGWRANFVAVAILAVVGFGAGPAICPGDVPGRAMLARRPEPCSPEPCWRAIAA